MSIRQGIKLPLYIITEYGYENSLWAPRLYVLIRHLKEKRLSYKQIEKNTDIDCGGKSGSVIAIGTTHSWLLSTIKVCNKLNIPIIVSGCKQLSVKDVVFSNVSSVREESLMVLKNYLSHYGKKRIALYAINQNSDADVYLAESVYSLMKFKGTDIQIIYNNETSLNDCFERLLERLTIKSQV